MPDAFEQKSEDIMAFLVKEVLRAPIVEEERVKKDDVCYIFSMTPLHISLIVHSGRWKSTQSG